MWLIKVSGRPDHPQPKMKRRSAPVAPFSARWSWPMDLSVLNICSAGSPSSLVNGCAAPPLFKHGP